MINKVILIGRLGADPEVKYLQDGTMEAGFSRVKEIQKPPRPKLWEKVVSQPPHFPYLSDPLTLPYCRAAVYPI
jgi:hypothetical protein